MHISDEVGLERTKCDNTEVRILKYILRWNGQGILREWHQDC